MTRSRLFDLWSRWYLLIALLLLTRLLWLDASGLWLDELGSWSAATTTPWADLLRLLADPHAGYPLYHVLLRLWVSIVGDSAWAMRLPSALAGVAAALVLADAARQLGRSATACLLLFIAAPLPLWYADEVTSYSVVLLWGAIWVWALLRFLADDGRAGRVLLIAAPLGLLLHRLTVLVVIGGIVAILCCAPRLSRQARGVLAVALVGLLAGLTFILHGGYLPASALAAASVSAPQTLWLTLWSFSLNRGPDESLLALLIPLNLLALWGGASLISAARADRPARGMLIAAAITGGLLLAQLTWAGRYEPRYLIVLYPTWALIALPPARLPQYDRPAAMLLALAVAAQLSANLLPGGLWGALPVREQDREAMTALLHTIHPDDRLLFYPPYLDLAWRYYAPRIDPRTPHLPVAAVDGLPPAWPGQREFVMVAPFHASVAAAHDPHPPDLTDPPGTIPCGLQAFQGVQIRCRVAAMPRDLPVRPLVAIFGDWLALRSADLLVPPDGLRPGDTLPVRLDWETLRSARGEGQFVLRLSRIGADAPLLVDAASALGGSAPSQTWAPSWRFTDRRAITLATPSGQPLPVGTYRVTLAVSEGGQALDSHGPDSGQGAELTLGEISIGPGGFAPCLAGRPDGCGQIRIAGAQLFDRRGPWVAHGVQFFLPQDGINEHSFWDDRYAAALADGSLDLWLDRAALRLHTNLLRIFVELPSRVDGQTITPTSYATITDFAERAAARGMRLGLVLHNSADWRMTPKRQAWIEGLISSFLERGTLERIAYISTDNEINNHCLPARQYDCFAIDPAYRDQAIGWATNFYRIIKARSPQLLVTVGMATELDAVGQGGGAANYWLRDRRGRTLADVTDFLAPHNYAGRADAVLADIRAAGSSAPVVLEEYGFPTDPAPRNAAYTEGPPTCRQDPMRPECLQTAPYYVELNLRALGAGGYAGGVAWMLADTQEKDLPGACENPAFTFDPWTGLLAAGHVYCDGGTRTRAEGAPKATALRVCAYHTGSIDLCIADSLFARVP
ncbi:hypothetical protein EKD04_012515 [Chloroflexales bacterium ZM16-3]|nr:hypothetical protein [Chloroflexales bacterium ZM16-3]